jgi:hypothetical protein
MSLSIYDLTVPVMLRGLNVTSDYLDKASAYSAEKKIDPDTLINARLAPDMQPFVMQIQRISDNCKGALGRLAGIETPNFPDTETTFMELKERIAKTISFVETIKPEQLQGSESRELSLKFRNVDTKMRGDSYLLAVFIPNFYFHITTAHDILRNQGLDIGKKDYLGNIL